MMTFEEALLWYKTAREMKDDLPDGQWDELEDLFQSFTEEYGRPNGWSKETKEEFVGEIELNSTWWL